MSRCVSEFRNNSFRVNEGFKSPDINNFGHSPRKNPLSFSPTATDSGPEEKWLLQKSSNTEQRISIGASLVGEKHQNIRWKDLNSASSSSSFTDTSLAGWGEGTAWEGIKLEGHGLSRREGCT